MQNLIIDIGNTAVKAAWADGMTIGKTFRYQGEKIRNFIASIAESGHPYVMVISSVYEISAADENFYAGLCSHILLLDKAHRKIFEDNSLPDWITGDRAASIIAVRHMFKGRGCTIMDLGTTFTIDFIDINGKYEGGNVSIGCRTRFKAINRYSRALPLVDTPETIQSVGTSCETSITSGIISGIMFEIEGYVAEHPDNIIVFTGGDANYFAKRMKNSIFVVCNLVLIGLALIADEYVKKID